MFGADLTDFSDFCYDMNEDSNSWYVFEYGCPYDFLKYYDGFALGAYTLTAEGDSYDIFDDLEDLINGYD